MVTTGTANPPDRCSIGYQAVNGSCPDSVDNELSCCASFLLFELLRPHIAERRMQTLPVVPDGDPLKDSGSSFLPRCKGRAIHELALQRGKEALANLRWSTSDCFARQRNFAYRFDTVYRRATVKLGGGALSRGRMR